MGANVSNTLYDSVYRSTYGAFTSMTTSLVQEQIGSIEIIQDVTINVMGDLTCTQNFNITQDAKGTLTVVSQLNQQAMADITNSIVNEIQRNVTTTLEQRNTGLNLGQVNVANSVNNTVSEMATQIATTVQQSVKQVVQSSGTVKQSITLNVFPGAKFAVGGSCNVTQAATMDVVAQSVADQVAKLAASNEQFNKLAEDFKTSLSQSNTGLTLAGMLVGVVVLIFILCVVFWVIKKVLAAPGSAVASVAKAKSS